MVIPLTVRGSELHLYRNHSVNEIATHWRNSKTSTNVAYLLFRCAFHMVWNRKWYLELGVAYGFGTVISLGSRAIPPDNPHPDNSHPRKFHLGGLRKLCGGDFHEYELSGWKLSGLRFIRRELLGQTLRGKLSDNDINHSTLDVNLVMLTYMIRCTCAREGRTTRNSI